MPPRKRAAPKPKLTAAERNCKFHCCLVSPERKAEISESISKFMPGEGAELLNYGPACHCGLRGVKERCPRHGASTTDG